MSRFYEQHKVAGSEAQRYFVAIKLPECTKETEVSKAVYEALDFLQKEHWRIERREARHVLHFEMMQNQIQQMGTSAQDPALLFIQRIEKNELWDALRSISPTQQRRFILHTLMELTVEEIASFEHCSTRAVKYSLALARKNLREILSE